MFVLGTFATAADFRFWHRADILSGSLNVRFQGQSGHRAADILVNGSQLMPVSEYTPSGKPGRVLFVLNP